VHYKLFNKYMMSGGRPLFDNCLPLSSLPLDDFLDTVVLHHPPAAEDRPR